MSARHQVHSLPGPRRQVQSGPDVVLDVHAEDEDCEIEMAQAVSQAVSASGVPLHKPGRTGNGGGKSFFFDLGPGVFWLDAGQRGEGLNLADFGADQYGMSFTVRAPVNSYSLCARAEVSICWIRCLAGAGRDWHVPAVRFTCGDGQTNGADAARCVCEALRVTAR